VVRFILLTLTLLAVTAAAAGASPLRVIASAYSSGDFPVTAANGEKSPAHALYLRGHGHTLSGEAVVACSRGIASIGSKSTTLSHMAAGRLHRVRQPFVGDCQVTASLSGSGRITLQVLAS
jgi:hypothetical protein